MVSRSEHGILKNTDIHIGPVWRRPNTKCQCGGGAHCSLWGLRRPLEWTLFKPTIHRWPLGSCSWHKFIFRSDLSMGSTKFTNIIRYVWSSLSGQPIQSTYDWSQFCSFLFIYRRMFIFPSVRLDFNLFKFFHIFLLRYIQSILPFLYFYTVHCCFFVLSVLWVLLV